MVLDWVVLSSLAAAPLASTAVASHAKRLTLRPCFFVLRSLPFDFVKTRMQKMERGPDGKYPYAGPVDCALQTFRKSSSR